MLIRPTAILALSASLLALSGCGSLYAPSFAIQQADLPQAVRVPDGHNLAFLTVGQGEITYECREKKDMAGQFEWAFVGPMATLTSTNGQAFGKYYAGPTWEAADGSKVTGKQVAVSPAAAGNIPLQLVKANPAMGAGAMQGVSYIQRLNTMGGIAPAMPCGNEQKGQRQQVAYKADYALYKPAM